MKEAAVEAGRLAARTAAEQTVAMLLQQCRKQQQQQQQRQQQKLHQLFTAGPAAIPAGPSNAQDPTVLDALAGLRRQSTLTRLPACMHAWSTSGTVQEVSGRLQPALESLDDMK